MNQNHSTGNVINHCYYTLLNYKNWQPLQMKCTQYILFEIHYYTIHIFGFWWSLTGNSIFFHLKVLYFVLLCLLHISSCMNVSRTLNNNLVCVISPKITTTFIKTLYKSRIIIITCGHVIQFSMPFSHTHKQIEKTTLEKFSFSQHNRHPHN